MRPSSRLPMLVLAAACSAGAVLSAAQAPADASGVRVPFERTTVWLGRTQLIPIELAEPAEADRAFDARTDDPGIAEVVRGAEVLAGETLGWLRLRGVAEGATALRIGESTVALEVRAPAASARVNDVSARIVSPPSGAVVWGPFAVGVEIETGLDDGVRRAPDVRLRLSTGELLEPRGVLPLEHGPVRRHWFEVDAGALPAGSLSLRALLSVPGGAAVESDAVRVQVVRAAERELMTGECEDLLGTPRPPEYGREPPAIGGAPDASGGAFSVHAAPDPVLIVPVSVQLPAHYQLAVRARGDFGTGAFPSLGVCADDPFQPRTSARLVASEWHWLPVGLPMLLRPGERLLALRFLADDERSGGGSRALHLDAFELLRLPDESASAPAPSMAMMSSMSMGASDDAGGLTIALERALHGLPVAGRIVLRAACTWPEAERSPPPRVALFVNGEEVQVQHSTRPAFELDPAALRAGDNTLAVAAELEDGRRARSPEQTVHLGAPLGRAVARAVHRFDVADPRFGAEAASLLEPEDRGRPLFRAAHLVPGSRLELALPEDLAGDFEVLLEARGPEWPDSAAVHLSLRGPRGAARAGDAAVSGWWNLPTAGRASLAGGDQGIVLEVPRGSELWLRAVVLRSARGDGRVPPRAEVLWPPEGHVAHGVDAVVVRALDDEGIARADLLIDGRAQQTHGRLPPGAGHLVLPLLLRDVAPGSHRLRVRVEDADGNLGESEELAFTVAGAAPDEPGRYARALHLLDRFGFGPEPEELAAVLVRGERDWLAARLSARGPGETVALQAASAAALEGGYVDAQRGVMVNALLTPNPVRARLALWLENHFSTWVQKTYPGPEWREHLELERLAPAPFAECLLASATSTAMVHYLDQAQSFAGALNENYAREVMELHTLGVDGGYDQGDVTALAGVLCGLTLAEEAPETGAGMFLQREFRYDPALAGGAAREVLGMRFGARPPEARFDDVRLALELLVAHPSTARFAARSLAEHYVSVPAPDALVEDLAAVFVAEGGDLAALLLALAEHPLFWAALGAPRVCTPLDYGVRLARAAESPEIEWAVRQFLERSGMGLLDRVTPDGWPESDLDWVDSNALLQRWALPAEVPWAVSRLAPEELREVPAGDLGAWRQRVVDAAAVRLTGRTLGPASNAAALEHMAGLEGNPWEVVQQICVLVAQLPEAGLR